MIRRTVVFLICFLLSAPAAADEAESETKRRDLYRHARELGAGGRWSEARDELQRVVELRSTPKALLALAYAELKLGHLIAAKRLYLRARDDGRAGASAEDVSAAEAGLSHVSERIPALVLLLPDDLAVHGLRIGIDGERVVPVNDRIDVDPGARRLTVMAPGRLPFQTTLRVPEGAKLKVRVLLTAPVEDEPVERATAPTAKPSGVPVLAPLILGAAGLGVGLTGGLIWLDGNRDYDDVTAECGGSVCPASKRSELSARADDARTKIQTGQVLVGVGAAVLSGAVIWLSLASGETTSNASSLHLGAVPTRTGLTSALRGTF